MFKKLFRRVCIFIFDIGWKESGEAGRAQMYQAFNDIHIPFEIKKAVDDAIVRKINEINNGAKVKKLELDLANLIEHTEYWLGESKKFMEQKNKIK